MQAGRKPPKMRTAKRPGKGPFHALGMLFKLLMIAAIIALIAGLFYPVSSTVKAGDSSRAAAYDSKNSRIDVQIRKIKLGQVAESSFKATYREEELNGKLAAFLGAQEQPEGKLALRINQMTINLEAGHLIMHMDTAALDGKLRLTYEVVVEPKSVDGKIKWEVLNGRIGHVPFPLALKDLVVGSKFADIFRYAEMEQSILEHAEEVSLPGDDQIIFKLNVR